MKSKSELLEYSIKIRERGDSYRSMLNYLNNNCEDEQLIREIISEVDTLEKQKRIKVEEQKAKGLPMLNLILGSIFLIGGIWLMVMLWGKGFISTVPFILIGVGVLGLTGAIK